MQTVLGMAQNERERVADLYWQAFGTTFGRILGPHERGRAFIAKNFRVECALCLHSPQGEVIGVAGFHSSHGALVEFNFASLRQEFGLFGAAWRSAALSLLDRHPHPARFVIQGICVDQSHRGNGIGSRLIEALAHEAKSQDYDALSLRVASNNTRARQLYLRRGFTPVEIHKLGILRAIFGFESTTTMVRWLH